MTTAEKMFKINIEPSFIVVANIAIMLMEIGDEKGKEEGRKLIRDMGDKLAKIRATQPDCPNHLK